VPAAPTTPAGSSCATGKAKTLTQYGITWTLDKEYPCGHFANGDYWVQGPVVLADIDPKPTAQTKDMGGSMLNPVPGEAQGFYKTEYGKYDAALNIALQMPGNLAVPAGSSIYSTINNPDTWAPKPNDEKTYFKETAVLTVLAQAPAPGSFRPPYAGVDKTIKANWTTAALNYGALKRLAPPNMAHVPDRKWLEDATQRPLLEMDRNWQNSNWKASWAENKAGGYARRTYGREVSHISSGAGLLLQTNLSNDDKQKLLIHMVQWGIDVSGLLKNKMQWQPNGGHNHGRLLPLFIAAKVLGDPEMLAQATPKSTFQEFTSHYFITQADIDRPRSSASLAPYTQAMLGMPEWSSGGQYEQAGASSDWNASGYRFINGAPNVAVVATIMLMGGRQEVGHEPLFRYIVERYYPKVGANHTLPSYGDEPTLFTRDMWEAYVKTL